MLFSCGSIEAGVRDYRAAHHFWFTSIIADAERELRVGQRFISELAVEQARLIALARRKPSLYAESRQLEEERITDDLRKKRFIRTR